MGQSSFLLRSFARYAAFGILGMIGISCYILADTFFIARGLGSNGLAALNIVIPAYNVMNGIGLMIGVGSATRYAVCRAQQDDTGAASCLRGALCLGLVAGFLFCGIGLLAAGPLASLLGADAVTLPLARTYLRTLLSFGPFFVMNNVMLAFVRNDGAPRRAMAGMVIGSLSNIILDYIFIFPLHMGMFGAALATGASPIISLLILRGHLRSAQCTLTLRGGVFRLQHLPMLCGPGVSTCIGEFSSGVVLFLFNLVLLRLTGNIGVAAYGIIANLALVAIAIFQGLSTGVQPLVSTCSGQQDRQGLHRLFCYTAGLAILIASVLYLLVFLFAAPLTAVFNNSGDPALTSYAIPGLRIYFTGFWFAGLNIVSAAFFSASGRAVQGFILSILRGGVAVVPLLLLLTTLFQVSGVWATFPAAEGATFLLTLFYIFRAFRQK